VNLDLVVFGSLSAIVTSVVLFYSYRGYQKFSENSELASTKLVLKDEVRDAYTILAFSAMAFSTMTLGGAFALGIEDFEFLQYLSELGGFIFMLGMIYFHRNIDLAVVGRKDDEEKE